MRIEFKESFLKDLRRLKDKKVKDKVRVIICDIERAKNILEIKTWGN